MIAMVAFLGGVAYSVDAYRFPVIGLLIACALLGAVLGWQKRALLARRAAGSLLGYADSVDCRKLAVDRWRVTISGAQIEQGLSRSMRNG